MNGVLYQRKLSQPQVFHICTITPRQKDRQKYLYTDIRKMRIYILDKKVLSEISTRNRTTCGIEV